MLFLELHCSRKVELINPEVDRVKGIALQMIYIPFIADALGRLLVPKTTTCPAQINPCRSDLPVDAQNRHSRLFLLFAQIVVRNMQSWSVNGLQTV